MTTFVGGSAGAMARDLTEGYVTLSAPGIRKWRPADFDSLLHELEKLGRELRGAAMDLDDTLAIQQRNRKLQRIQHAEAVLHAARLKALRLAPETTDPKPGGTR